MGFAGQITEQLIAEDQTVVPYGPGLALAWPLVVPLIEDEHLADIEIEVVNDQPACIAITAAEGKKLTGSFLRSLPIAHVVSEAAACNTYRVFKRGEEHIGVYYSDAFENTSFGGEFETLRYEVGRRPRILNKQFFERVASIYREALAHGYPPARAVEETLGPTTPENARRWIGRARKEGLLGPAPGRGSRGEL